MLPWLGIAHKASLKHDGSWKEQLFTVIMSQRKGAFLMYRLGRIFENVLIQRVVLRGTLDIGIQGQVAIKSDT